MSTISSTLSSPDELRALLALHLTPNLGPMRIQALLLRFGSARAVLQAPSEQLQQVPHIGPQLAASLTRGKSYDLAENELEALKRAQAQVLVLGTPEYPEQLASIPGAPPLLYVRGTLTPADDRAVAVVGTRRCSSYGRKMAEQLASALARVGITVISGLARGIDGIAHQACLDAGGRTIAVLAGGLSRIYPPEHLDLAQRVAESGALLTESALGQEPLRGLFPARNRIISGLARAIVIIEAPRDSGALITARCGAEQGRSVLAVPGPADSENSAGCNDLIRDGAVLCQSVDDVLAELQGLKPSPCPKERTPRKKPVREKSSKNDPQSSNRPGSIDPIDPIDPIDSVTATVKPPVGPNLNAAQMQIWEYLESRICSIEELTQGLSLAVPTLSVLLMELEMRKVVRRLPGNRFERQ